MAGELASNEKPGVRVAFLGRITHEEGIDIVESSPRLRRQVT